MSDHISVSPIELGLLANLLGQRYGDGTIYLHTAQDRHLLKKAKALGLVSEAGYLTRAGQEFLQTRSYRPIAPQAEDRRDGVELLGDTGY